MAGIGLVALLAVWRSACLAHPPISGSTAYQSAMDGRLETRVGLDGMMFVTSIQDCLYA